MGTVRVESGAVEVIFLIKDNSIRSHHGCYQKENEVSER